MIEWLIHFKSIQTSMNQRRPPSIAALVEELKSQQHSSTPKDWKELEDHVQYVYQTLLDLKGEKVVVARDVTIRGRTGQEHQVDVYYDFELAGVRHQVAIECKDHKRPVDKDRVLAFSAKINDCPGVLGIMVATSGYQSGATKFAEDNGLMPLELGDLPSLGHLLGMRLERNAIPSEDAIGQPFWTIIERQTAAPQGFKENGRLYGVLFFSRHQARLYFEARSMGPDYSVCGLTQENLFTYVLTVDAMAGRYLIVQRVVGRGPEAGIVAFEISRRDLISEYYVGEGSLPSEPQVMPSVKRRMERETR